VAGAASSHVFPVDNAAEPLIAGVVVAPDDVLADHAGLLLVAGEVGAVQCDRPHRTLHRSPPAWREHPPALGVNVRAVRRDRLGGLIHEYTQVACG
jgi:hypothetical protein